MAPRVRLSLEGRAVPSSSSFTTDSSGNFSFSGLAAGNYTLTETPPSGYADVSNLLGTNISNGSTSTNAINFTLGAGVNSGGFEFADQFIQGMGGS
jgi:hypothetical protein